MLGNFLRLIAILGCVEEINRFTVMKSNEKLIKLPSSCTNNNESVEQLIILDS